ncbi:ABC transporter permease [Oleiagrimonas sp. C23AA]|uniref:ABC transporter permease n=1 Tax=Oleiagrimonas sp. C23AA TaxID=2719047 RepID=UPI00141F5BDD|nr:ABC transporter permease [Oleiagrimonas sp. C23AA]NII12027.1 FtsX-like permease family protein [Oleiagrimonas sp. C23AA]
MFGYSVNLAWQGVKRHPRSSAMAVVVMALGLAACMTVLTVFHALAADPLPGRSGVLTTVLLPRHGEASNRTDATLSVDMAQRALGQLSGVRMAAVIPANGGVGLADTDTPSLSNVDILATTSNVGEVFDIPLIRGRWWSAQDDASATPVAVISQRLAQRLFGSTSALGQQIKVGGKLVRVVGVHAPWAPSLRFYAQLDAVYDRDPAQVIMPMSVASGLSLYSSSTSCPSVSLTNRDWHSCSAASLWAYDLSPAQRQRLRAVAKDIGAHLPVASNDTSLPRAVKLLNVDGWLRLQRAVPDSMRAYVWVALSFLALCLFNAAGVLAARFMRRGSELGIRRALGASQRDVFAQHLVESGALAVLGGALAWPLILGGMDLLRMQQLAYGDLVRFDIGTFLALCLATLITGLAVGVYPAWRAAMVPPALQVKQN